MRVVFRVDSSQKIGSGHLMRCLTLAERLKQRENADIHFICRNLKGNISSLTEKLGYHMHLLPFKPVDNNLKGYESWLTVPKTVDSAETIRVLKTLGNIDMLVEDSYALDYEWETTIRSYIHNLFVIDDLANRRHNCDVLLDQNYYEKKEHRYDGLVPSTCRLLLGPEYALLRKEFFEVHKHLRQRNGKISNILVFYGGSDNTDETTKAIQALKKINPVNIDADIIVGSSNARQDKIKKLCDKSDFLHYHCQINNMAEYMNKADLMLGAGGSTTWERCFLRLPAIVTGVAENQFQGCIDCAKKGLFCYLGKYYEVSETTIFNAIKKLCEPKVLSKMQKSCSIDVKTDW